MDRLERRNSLAARSVIIDHEFSDDGAVVRTVAGRNLIVTAAVISQLVDDPDALGAIAAAGALSEVWARGGEPRFALNLVFFPDDVLPLHVLDSILAGSGRICAEAGVAVVGGHSVRDPEVRFGLSVTGDVEPRDEWSPRSARAGQALVLTKALGTGAIGRAIKRGAATEAAAAAAIRSMATLDRAAARIGRAHGATAATAVSRSGLLGRVRDIALGSRAAATIELEHLPLLPDAVHHAREEPWPPGSRANRAQIAADTAWADGTPLAVERGSSDRELLATLACDAQTSGGLLLCVPVAHAEACVVELRTHGLPAARIGSLATAGGGPAIILR